MLKALLLAALLPGLGFADEAGFSDFSAGLNTRISPILLGDNESPDLDNVVLDETAGIKRRKGFSKLNSSAIGDGDDEVNAVYQLEQSDGDRFCVAFSSTSGYYSTDGCQTFTLFVSTLTRGNDVNCDSYNDELFCVNNQYNFKFTGTDDIAVTGIPASSKYIKVWRDRCFATGAAAYPSRLYWSDVGGCTTYSATSYVDIETQDGDVTTGIGEPLANHLPVYKKFSTHLIQFDGANPANRKVITVSKTTGAKHHRAIAGFQNRQYFDSVGPNGGQPGIYMTDGINIQEASGKVRGALDGLANFSAASARKTLDTKTDWDAGTFDAYALSTSRDVGLLQSSYTALTQTTEADWSLGTLASVSTYAIVGTVTLSSTVSQDNFSDGEYTSNLAWTVTAGSFDVADSRLRGLTTTGGSAAGPQNWANTATQLSSGSWSFAYYFSVGADLYGNNYYYCASNGYKCLDYRFMQTTGGDFYSVRVLQAGNDYSTAKTVKLVKSVSASETDLISVAATLTKHTEYVFEVIRSSHGVLTLYQDGVLLGEATDTGVTTSAKINVGLTAVAGTYSTINNQVTDVYFYRRASSGTWTSPVYDTYISTPVWGLFDASLSSSSLGVESKIAFTIHSSSDAGVTFGPYVAQTPDLELNTTSYRWVQYQAAFESQFSSQSPRLNSVTIAAASTGTWTSPEIFLSNTMSATWGLFQTEQTTTGSEASIAYTIKTSPTQGGASAATAVAVTPGSAISASTGAYVIISALYTVGVATETAYTDSITLNWNEGSTAKSATMKVFKNRLHYCGQTIQGTENNVCYVMDSNGAWVRWTSVPARFLNVVNQNFVMAGSSAAASVGGYLFKLYDTESDNGAAINAYWESKDHFLTKIQNVKAVDRLYVVHKNDAATLTTTLKSDTGLGSASYDMNMSTGASFGVQHRVVDTPINGNSFRLRFGNNAISQPWEVQGYGIMYRDLGLMP